MEIGLKKENYVFYDTKAELSGAHEEVYETIVPDALPDILSITDSYGLVLVSSRELREERADISGQIRASVMYSSESGSCEHISLQIPFSHSFEINGGEGCVLMGGAELQSIDTRTINPRKIIVRASVRVWAKIIEPKSFELCSGLAEDNSSVQILTEKYSATLPCAAGRRSFTIEDRLELPATRPPAARILRYSCNMPVSDYSVIGRKVVFKGIFVLKILYMSHDGEFLTHTAEIPFSQIADLDGLEDKAECVIRLFPEDISLVPDESSDGRSFDLTFTAEAQVEAYITRSLETVGDLYSTSMKSAVDIRPYSFTGSAGRTSKRQTIRDMIEVPVQVRQGCDAEVYFDAVRTARTDEGVECSANATVRALYMDESGALGTATKKLQVSAVIPSAADTACTAAVSAENIAVSAGVNGVEVRFDVCFEAEFTKREIISAVEGARLEEYGDDAPVRPSVVLRYPSADETLWQMAKRYNTTVDDICAANGITGEPDMTKLLLIPKRR